MRARARPTAAAAALVIVAVAATAGCSREPVTNTSTSARTVSASPSAAAFRGVSVQGPTGQQPIVLIGDETAATSSIQIEDVVTGEGAMAGPTSPVTVQYVARGAKTKRTFDSSWDRGSTFRYDPKKVTFAAFVDGVPGMRVGGRRIVIVPGSLAFGATPPAGSGLQPNEAVVFVIDLVKAD